MVPHLSRSPDRQVQGHSSGYFKSKERLVQEVLQMHLHAIKTDSAPIE